MQGSMMTVAASAAALTALSAFADHRRRNRADIERVGFMPWPMISIASVMVALFAFALAIRN
jgi:hypothetical protein